MSGKQKLLAICCFCLMILPQSLSAALSIDNDVLEVMGIDSIHYNTVTELDLLQKFGLYAENDLDFHDRAVLYPSSNENRLFWGDYVNIGSGAKTDTVIAGDGTSGIGIWVRGGTVDGDAALAGIIDYQNGGEVLGDSFENQQIEMPSLSHFTPGVVSFPAVMEGPYSFFVLGGSMNADPNYYHGNITVHENQTLRLPSCGNYYFESMHFDSGSHLEIGDPNCETNIFVKQQLIWRGTVVVPEGETVIPENLLWGVFGTADAFLETSFWGTIVAPNGRVVLACGKNLAGAVFANNIRIMQDARIIARNGALDNVFVPGWSSLIRPIPMDVVQVPNYHEAPVIHECAFDGFEATICYENGDCLQEFISWIDPYNRKGFPCDWSSDDITVGDTCSIVKIDGFPRQNIKSWHIEMKRLSSSTYPYTADTQFVSWYWWDADSVGWDGPADPWVSDITVNPPIYWSGDIAGPAADGAVWLWKDGFWAGGDIGCGPSSDTVTNGDTWVNADLWGPDPDADCNSNIEGYTCWGDHTGAVSAFGYRQDSGSFNFSTGQSLVAFNYQCDVYCEGDCGTPETVIFQIAD